MCVRHHTKYNNAQQHTATRSAQDCQQLAQAMVTHQTTQLSVQMRNPSSRHHSTQRPGECRADQNTNEAAFAQAKPKPAREAESDHACAVLC